MVNGTVIYAMLLQVLHRANGDEARNGEERAGAWREGLAANRASDWSL